MIWLSFAKWSSHSTSMFVWERVYRNGYRWPPFIMARRRYGGYKRSERLIHSALQREPSCVNWDV